MRSSGVFVRPALPTVVSAVLGAALLGVVLAVVPIGNPAFVLVVFAVQVLLATSWLALLSAPSRLVGVVISVSAALAADLLLSRNDDDVVGALAGVIALGLIAAVLAQLAARQHRRVTELLAAHTSAILVVSSSACIVAVRGAPHGHDAAVLTMSVLALGSLLARVTGLVAPRWVSVGAATFGVLVWVAVGGLLGAAVLGPDGLVIGLATGAAAAFADLLVAAADAHRRALLLAALLPLASGAPVAYVLSRVMLG
jgi:hypothetical protein